MGFELRIETDNAAFEADMRGEVARILNAVAQRVLDGWEDGRPQDINGNTVGTWELSGQE